MYGDDDDDDDDASSGRKELLPLELLCLLPNQAEQVEELNKTSRTKIPNFPDFIFEFVQPCNGDEKIKAIMCRVQGMVMGTLRVRGN